ncbi:MAG: hypothetical protein KME17_27800 [Cyanosarcina radialis HA8281-LM2]|nr:hypothetical protein [Cyanosarcina radialis HA8281-LM2]
MSRNMLQLTKLGSSSRQIQVADRWHLLLEANAVAIDPIKPYNNDRQSTIASNGDRAKLY